MKLNLRFRIITVVVVTLLIWAHIAWDYFHDGVPTHYLFQNGDLPGLSNWWGAILIPVFTWFLLYRIQKRIDGHKIIPASDSLRSLVLRFIAAVLIAISISICFTMDIDIILYIVGALFILAFFLPLYRSEYLLGFVLGSAFTFGAIIPVGFGSILVLLFFLLYKATKTIVTAIKPQKGV